MTLKDYNDNEAVRSRGQNLVSTGGWVKVKLQLPHFHVSDTCRVSISCVNLTRCSRCSRSSRCCYRACVSMSTRPDPERSGAVEIATRRCPRLRVVWDLRAHPLTKTQAMEPSRRTRSSYGPPYPLGRWSRLWKYLVSFRKHIARRLRSPRCRGNGLDNILGVSFWVLE